MRAGELVTIKKDLDMKVLMVGMILEFEENNGPISPESQEGAIVFWIQGPQAGKEMWYPLILLEVFDEV